MFKYGVRCRQILVNLMRCKVLVDVSLIISVLLPSVPSRGRAFLWQRLASRSQPWILREMVSRQDLNLLSQRTHPHRAKRENRTHDLRRTKTVLYH